MPSTRCIPEKFPNQKEHKCFRVIYTEGAHFCCPMKTSPPGYPAPQGPRNPDFGGGRYVWGEITTPTPNK